MRFYHTSYFRVFLAFFLFSAFSDSGLAQSKTGLLTVTKVSDGDTFWVTHPSGKEEKIRLIGINAPESRRTGRTEVEYFGKEASAFAKQLLLNKRVRLEFDVQKYDRYKRTLAYAYLESGTMVNALLVKEGYARVATYPPNVRYQEIFQKLEREARSVKRGLWR
jgi:micrococcal nuclease